MSAPAPTSADPERLAAALQAVGPRPACSDGERRAALLLAHNLRALGRRPRTETLWVRPQWAAVWLVHAVAGLAASIASPSEPGVALAVLAAASASALAELAGLPALSLLWPRRATQNVVSEDPRHPAQEHSPTSRRADRGDAAGKPRPKQHTPTGKPRPAADVEPAEAAVAPVRLVVTAAYDAPRRRTPLATPLRHADAALRRATGGWWPSPLGLLTLSLLALAGCAGARLAGVEAVWLGAIQVVPTVVCIVAVALLVDIAVAAPAAGANPAASAPAAALALVAALDREPLRRLAVDVVLAGAGDAMALGMRRFVRARARAARPEGVAVLHLEPCGAGAPAVWRRDGPLLSLALHPQLVACAEAAGFLPHAGRGVTGALAARRARWPAVAVGRLDAHGEAPDDLDAADLRDTVERCLALVRQLDDELTRNAPA